MIHQPQDVFPMGGADHLNAYFVRNETGSAIGASGTYLIVEQIESTDSVGKRREVQPAEPENMGAAPVLWVTKGLKIPDGKRGQVFKSAFVAGVNTAGATVGDPVYLASGGAWSLSGIVVVGFVTRVHATTGSVYLAPQQVRSDLGAPGLGQTKRMSFALDVSAITSPGATYTYVTVPNGQKWSFTNLRLTTTVVMDGTGVTTGDIGVSGDTAAIADASTVGHDATVGTYYNDTLAGGSDCWDNTNANAEDYEVDASGGAVDVIIALGTSPTTGKVVMTADVTRTV